MPPKCTVAREYGWLQTTMTEIQTTCIWWATIVMTTYVVHKRNRHVEDLCNMRDKRFFVKMTTYDHQCNWHMSSFWQHRSSVCPQNAPLHVNNISKYTRENNHKPAIQNILGWIQTLSVHVKRPFRKLCRHKQNETSDKFRPKYTALFFCNNGAKKQKNVCIFAQ